MAKYFLILRGVSGAGKSTYAKKLQEVIWRFNSKVRNLIDWTKQCAIVSADNYFIRPDGLYDFNARVLRQAHEWCRKEVERMMENDVQVIILDNTNTQKWEYEKYAEIAKANGYKIKDKIIGKLDEESLKIYAGRNAHGVPPEAIARMAKRFEK